MDDPESWTSSRESEALASASNGPDLKQRPFAKSNPIADKSSESTGQTCESTTTSGNSMEANTQDQLTLFAADTLVNHFQPQESSKAKPTRATSGRKCEESFEKHAPAGSLPKMFADILASVSTPLPHNWKMTASPSGRLLFQLAPLGLRTNAKESGLWHTPRALMIEESVERFTERMGDRKGNSAPNLAVQVKHPTLWPTPHANCSTGAGTQGRQGGMNLQTAAKLWPTASARDWKDTPGMATKGVNPDGTIRNRTDQLARAVYAEQWPTPTASRRSGLQSHGKNAILGSLNPDWVEGLMAFPRGWTDLGKPESPALPLESQTESSD